MMALLTQRVDAPWLSQEISSKPEVIEGVSKLLTRTNSKIQRDACKAIGNFARSDTVASSVVSTPGMLDNLAVVMTQDDTSAQMEAARAIANCGAYSSDAAEAIVANKDVLSALQGLTSSKNAQLKSRAVAAIATLSAYPMCAKKMKEETTIVNSLMPMVSDKKSMFGSNDLFQSTRLDAMTAVTNLDGTINVSKPVAKDALKSFKMCLDASLKGSKFAGTTWAPLVTLIPLSKLSNNPEMQSVFGELKFVKSLVRALSTSDSLAEQAAAMQCLANLSNDKQCLSSMRKAKYNVAALCTSKLSCPHSKLIAEFLLGMVTKEDNNVDEGNNSQTEETTEGVKSMPESDDEDAGSPSGKIPNEAEQTE